MLKELETLHAEVLMLVDELERLTADRVMRAEAVAAARLKLTRASRRRTRFLETEVYPALIRDCAEPDTRRVQDLRDTGKERLIASINHIAKWTIRDIAENWPGYCAASRLVRAAMRERVREEQAVLYPLLRV